MKDLPWHNLDLAFLPLNIETGRFRNQPIEQRICNLCEVNEIEDEFQENVDRKHS